MADSKQGEYGVIRYPVFDETPRRSQNFTKFEFEKANEILADRALIFAAQHNCSFSRAIKLVARRDHLEFAV